MPKPTPEDHAAIELRITHLKTRMDRLDHLRRPEHIAERAALYEMRDALEKLLGNDS